MATFYNSDDFGRVISQGSKTDMPKLSTKLDSIRAYQWEIEFNPPGELKAGDTNQTFTIAAKQVSELGYNIEDIVVNRVNDRYYYPGKPTPDEVTVTFDNLLDQGAGPLLYKWAQHTYNPLTGEYGDINLDVKSNVIIHQLNGNREPISSVTLYAAYPKSYRTAEYNYATEEFHTIQITFRFDFMSSEA